jgi:hypothetical protein
MASAYFRITAFSAGAATGRLIFLITNFRCFRIFGIPSHLPLGICHQITGVAINQPQWYSLLITFGYSRNSGCFHYYHLWNNYRLPGLIISPPLFPCLGKTSGIPSHFPLGICHQITGVSI